jgi:hypothetical protein
MACQLTGPGPMRLRVHAAMTNAAKSTLESRHSIGGERAHESEQRSTFGCGSLLRVRGRSPLLARAPAATRSGT